MSQSSYATQVEARLNHLQSLSPYQQHAVNSQVVRIGNNNGWIPPCLQHLQRAVQHSVNGQTTEARSALEQEYSAEIAGTGYQSRDAEWEYHTFVHAVGQCWFDMYQSGHGN